MNMAIGELLNQELNNMNPQNNQAISIPHPFSMNIKDGISIFTAIKNRKETFEETIKTWVNLDKVDEIIIVDWDSEESIAPVIEKYQNGKIFLATVKNQPRWILSFAYNLAASLTSRTRILKMDADVKLSTDFFQHHPLHPGIFYTGNWKIARNENERHLHGTCFIWREDFFAVNGYNEFIKSYGWDDIDLYDRLEGLPLKRLDLNLDDLYHIPHENRTANQTQLDRLKNVNDSEKALVNALINKFLSSVYKPWSTVEKPLGFTIEKSAPHQYNCIAGADINVLSPEILQKCELRALTQRLKERKMALPEGLAVSLSHSELVLLFNLLSQNGGSNQGSIYYELVAKIIRIADELANEKVKAMRSEFETCQQTLSAQTNYVNLIHQSYSWKFGHSVFSLLNLAIKPAKSLKYLFLNNWFPTKKINLENQIGNHYGKHRSGWSYAIAGLADLHNPHGILLDSFIERTFGWNPDGITSHKSPWIGFIHVPPNPPPWFHPSISNGFIFSLPQWKESMGQCKGLFTLTNYHKKYLEKYLPIPINNLLHPTEIPELHWSWQKFISNKEKKVIQVGYWLRKLYSIHLLQARNFKKIFIIKDDTSMEYLLNAEKENYSLKDYLTVETLDSVDHIPFQSNQDYDQLLSNNIVYLDLYDSSANNAIIECIVRNTPVLVNPIEPVIEYLGKDYPLYFTTHDQASEKLQNFDLIKQAHEYLKDLPLKKKLTVKYFRKSFLESPVYQNL